jgi:hypothetical protein
MAQKPKTRKKSGSNFSDFVGGSRPLLPSELPTERACLRAGLELQRIKIIEEGLDKGEYEVKKIMSDLLPLVKAQWVMASTKLSGEAILSDRQIHKKLVQLWKDTNDVAWGRVKQKKKDKVMYSLDRLLDISKCRCALQSCEEVSCEGNCKSGPHMVCHCPPEKKLPKLELGFILAQRSKTGDYGALQIGHVDTTESKKMKRSAARKEEDAKRVSNIQEDKQDGGDEVEVSLDESVGVESSTDDIMEFIEPQIAEPNEKSERNMTNVEKVALAAIRYNIGDRPTAAIATATLECVNIVSKEDKSQVIDHHKIARAKSKVMEKIKDAGERLDIEDTITCMFFDGRKDKTKYMVYSEETGKYYRGEVKEEHYSLTVEPSGRYADHFVPDEATKESSYSKNIAKKIVRWLMEHESEDTFLCIGGDSTNVNTGWKGGAMSYVEDMLGRRLVWVVCSLHTNERPLRALVEALDGPTTSNTGFSGPAGKLLPEVGKLPINSNFEKIVLGEDLPELPDEVVTDLSSDQKHAYQLCRALRSQVLSGDLANLKCGKLDHARWLTTANALSMLWMRQHGLIGQDLENLRMIIQWLVGSYYPMWFQIKSQHHWLQGPHHVLHQLKLWRLQDAEVQYYTLDTVQRGSWYAHSEHLLQTLISSESEEDRRFAINKIVEIREKAKETEQKKAETIKGRKKSKQVDHKKIRDRKTPELNMEAKNLKELISWEADICEPVLTENLTEDQLREYYAKPMEVPYFCLHTQSVERCVKQTTQASKTVYGYKKRDQYIRASAAHRKELPVFNTKKHY